VRADKDERRDDDVTLSKSGACVVVLGSVAHRYPPNRKEVGRAH